MSHDRIIIERHFDLANSDIFKINDKSVLLAEFKKMLMSVGLNIDNAHFMVLQNQIQKLANMKEAEYLHLLEECCGIKMYDDILKKARREIQNKSELFEQCKEKLNQLSEQVKEEEKNKEKFNQKMVKQDILHNKQIHIIF